MKNLWLGLAVSLMTLHANAAQAVDAIVCNEVGYTNKPENFDAIKTRPKTNIFLLGTGSVVFRDKVFTAANPDMVGIDGLDQVYYRAKDNRILYIYKDDQGATNVGISQMVKDSDAGFADKSQYSHCWSMNKTDALDAPAQPTPGAQEGGVAPTDALPAVQGGSGQEERLSAQARQ